MSLTHRFIKVTAGITGVMLCCLGSLTAAPTANDSALRTTHWREDLDFFARQLAAKQKDFSQLIPQSNFDRAVTELKGKVPQLSNPEIVFELMRIAASLGVAHTDVAFGSAVEVGNLHAYPVQMQWFSDELAIVAATPGYQETLGCRVVRMGSFTPRQVEAIIAPYISHENDAKLRIASPRFMNLVELMRWKKIADPQGRLQLTLARTNGEEFQLEIKPAGRVRSSRRWVNVMDVWQIPTGLGGEHPKAFYWYKYLPDTHALYIQYSKCANEPNVPFAAFARALFAYADPRQIERVIVDLRLNRGGSSSVVKPLIEGLKSRPAFSARERLYVLISGQTYSSGVITAMAFRTDLHAVLVGEPAGNKPNHYGEQKSFVLPNSKLRVHYSVKHMNLIPGADPSSVDPDIMVPNSLADFLAGRDRALETALHHPLP